MRGCFEWVSEPDDRIFLNGINGATGEYLVAPLSIEDAVAQARGMPTTKAHGGWLKRIVDLM